MTTDSEARKQDIFEIFLSQHWLIVTDKLPLMLKLI